MEDTTVKTTVLSYDLKEFPFPEIIRQHLGVEALDELHLLEKHELFDREHDQNTSFHRKYYEGSDAFYAAYKRFVKEVIRPIFNEPICFQKIPTFRVHLVGNVGVGEFHRDSDYNHQSHEINFLLPFTRAWGNNTMWIESAIGANDPAPVDLETGQFLMFNGANLLHGNKVNDTGKTRVSVDFRVVPMSKYTETTASSVNMGMRFVIGEYFELLED